MNSSATDGTPIDLTLTIPASSDHIRFARLVASAAATKLGFDYDTIEDLRIAVSELCTAVVESCEGEGTLTLTYCADGVDAIRIDGRAAFRDGMAAGAERDELVGHILEAVADEHSLDLGPTGGSFMLRMGSSRPSGS